jgi:hypothetical protein
MAHEISPYSTPGLTNLEKALADIGNSVYAATSSAEDLENTGEISGNGHHLRQEMVLRVQILLYNAWMDQEEKDQLSPTHPVKTTLLSDQK